MQTLAPLCVLIAVSAASACNSPTEKLLRGGRVVAVVPTEIERNLDILFVIDNSGSMSEEQLGLIDGVDELMAELAEVEGGLPDLHVGVVSSDVGAGPFNISGCTGNGDNGLLQVRPRSEGCTPPSDSFISDLLEADGTRTTNYTDSLPATFACIARLGIDGCGFEQPLESMRRALDGRNPENAGFLRADAWLAVIFLTDEDDCSTANTQMFDTGQNAVDDPLGPLSSYRCFEFGVVCDDDDARALGPRQSCRPREDSQFMYAPAEYADFLRSLKADPSRVFVAGIIGDVAPVEVVADVNGNPELAPSCESDDGAAAPAIRMNAVLDSFPARSRVERICGEQLVGAMTSIGHRLRDVVGGTPCLDGPVESPLRCTVHDVRGLGSDFEDRVELPECDTPGNPGGSANQPCYAIAPDVARCPDTDTSLAVSVFPLDREVLAGTNVVVTCAVVE